MYDYLSLCELFLVDEPKRLIYIALCQMCTYSQLTVEVVSYFQIGSDSGVKRLHNIGVQTQLCLVYQKP